MFIILFDKLTKHTLVANIIENKGDIVTSILVISQGPSFSCEAEVIAMSYEDDIRYVVCVHITLS